MAENRIRLSSAILSALGLLQLASVAPAHATTPFTAEPFVVGESPSKTQHSAGLATAPGSPFSIRVNSTSPQKGNYSGITITPTYVANDFQNLSFQLNGPTSTQVVVHSRRPGATAFNYSMATVNSVSSAKADKTNGFEQITLSASQLHLLPGSVVDRIVVSTNDADPAASFLIKDVRVNGSPVNVNVSGPTRFYKVASGPKGAMTSRVSAAPATLTTLTLTNSTTATQYFYVTFIPYPSGYTIGCPAVANLTLSGANLTPPETQINVYSTTAGWFQLNQGHTVTITPPSATPTISANFYVVGPNKPGSSPPNANCIGGTPGNIGIGATFAEVTLNVDGVLLGDETSDISEVNGVNALYTITLPVPSTALSTTNYPKYFDLDAYLFSQTTTVQLPTKERDTFTAQQLIPVFSIANAPGRSPFTGDRNATLPYPSGYTNPATTNGNVGVYPFGCDICTGRSAPGCSTATYTPASQVEQTIPLCQVNRYSGYQIGGTVNINLTKFPYPAKAK